MVDFHSTPRRVTFELLVSRACVVQEYTLGGQHNMFFNATFPAIPKRVGGIVKPRASTHAPKFIPRLRDVNVSTIQCSGFLFVKVTCFFFSRVGIQERTINLLHLKLCAVKLRQILEKRFTQLSVWQKVIVQKLDLRYSTLVS